MRIIYHKNKGMYRTENKYRYKKNVGLKNLILMLEI